MRSYIVAPVALLAAVVAVAGCGSSSSTKTAASTPAPSPAVSTASKSSADAASTSPSAAGLSNAALLAITLQPNEIPAGYTATPYQPDPNDAADQLALVQCVGGTNTAPDQLGQQDSPNYDSDGASISSEADSFKSQADITADVAILNSPKFGGCYEQLIKSTLGGSLPAGSTVNSASFTLTPGSNGGPSNVDGLGTATVNVTIQGKPTTIYSNLAFITGPSIEAQVEFDNTGSPVPAAVQSALIADVATRAAAG
jgi:hypothetical protein